VTAPECAPISKLGFASWTEPLDLTTLTGRATARMPSIFAELECECEGLLERVRAGIAQARREGRRHGRPWTASRKADEVWGLKSIRCVTPVSAVPETWGAIPRDRDA
jgi:DNA invertase Pin-like site-specific DNA recombinase